MRIPTACRWVAVVMALTAASAPAADLRQAAQLLTTVAATPLHITVLASGGLDMDDGMGRVLKDCRPYLASRPVGQQVWREERSVYKIISQNEKTIVLEAPFAQFKATVTLQRDAAGRYEISGKLDAVTQQPMELARFHYLDGVVSDSALNLLSMRQYELPGRIIKPSEKLPAPRNATWGWKRLDEPLHGRPNTAISGDSGMLAADWNSPGFFFGFTGPGSAFGELGIRTTEAHTPFFLAVLLDAVRLDPGQSRPLETAVISYGDPQDEFRHWIGRCRDALGPARVRPPLTGYCSWYQTGQGVKPADIRRAINGFASFGKPPGGSTIQIDDGFQIAPGNWAGRGEWQTELNKLPAEIKARGFLPGIWVAPTAIHQSHPIVKQHPEWLQRNARGDFCITFHNWRKFNGETNGNTYFLEPDHPEARAFIRKTLRDLRAAGWDYFKIDFAYTVSSDRAKYDPYKTTYESLHDQWKLFREALGEDAIINSCNGGIWRYNLGLMDVSRIGGDIGGSIKHLRRNLAEMMLRGHVNGVWFQADPDVFYMRAEKSSLTFEQSHLLTATQGLLGTALLTSDFADQWNEKATEVVQRYWNRQGPRVPQMLRIVLRNDGLPAGLAVAYGNGEYAVGLYNWNAECANITSTLKDLRLPVGEKYAIQSSGTEETILKNGELTVSKQPGESLRIISLRTLP